MSLEPDRNQLEIFVDAMFRHAAPEGFVSLRAFPENTDGPPVRITPVRMTGGLRFLIEAAEDDARRAANNPPAAVFCPPIATFTNPKNATETDLVEGLTISVECDEHAQAAREKLEALLGAPTLVVESGGKWTNPATKEAEAKLHLHWRLKKPARGEDRKILKQARTLAANIVGADPSNIPVVHPIRWPGSWHRKGEAVPCSIQIANPDNEIDLAAALAALQAAAPAISEDREPAHVGQDWSKLIADITTGRSYHASLVSLSSKYVASGMKDGGAVNALRGLMSASQGPRDDRWLTRYDKIPSIVRSARRKFGGQEDEAQANGRAPKDDFAGWASWWRDPATIPPREFLFGRHYIRRFVGATIAGGGRAKTTHGIYEAVSMAVGRDLSTMDLLPTGPLRVSIINAEEDQDELDRRIAATIKHYGITDLGGRLFAHSVRSQPVRFATLEKGVPTINSAAVANLIRFNKAHAIDVFMIDPLISFHSVQESENTHMDLLVKQAFGVVADETNSAGELFHHPGKPKPGQPETTVDDGRGASAVLWAVRSARVMNFMTVAEAGQLGISEKDRRLYIKIANGKANMGPLGNAEWIRLEIETLPNSDRIAVSSSWTPPDAFKGVTNTDLELAVTLAKTGVYRADMRSPEWFGFALAKQLQLNVSHGGENDLQDLVKLKNIIKTWLKNKVLAVEERLDLESKKRAFIVPGPADPAPRATREPEAEFGF